MKLMTKALVVALALFALSTAPQAQAATQPSIAVVDVQMLLTDSKAGKNIQEQLEAHKSKFLTELGKQEQKLRDDEKALTEQRASLPADEFAKKAQEFEGKLGETRRQAQERKRAIEEAASKSVTKLRDEIVKIVQGISDEKGYTLVLNRQNTVISSKDLDITQQAMEKLNQKISQIPLEIADK